jgi:hypothetical protein
VKFPGLPALALFATGPVTSLFLTPTADPWVLPPMPPGLAGAAEGATLGEGLDGAENELERLALDDELECPPPLPPPERPILLALTTVDAIASATTIAEKSFETFILKILLIKKRRNSCKIVL